MASRLQSPPRPHRTRRTPTSQPRPQPLRSVHLVGVRDSKNPTGPAVIFTPGAWDTFTVGVASGAFGQP
ncbi:DUF397 domain-containing protein [Nocardia sputi]|uniref:DUF397 domain-containing protein n=1 Tax=Nocardia sputi TaxID=2943705 RepID=UPI0020BE65C8|nr:DUF397 domain-containing protein [Nocardia sputi]